MTIATARPTIANPDIAASQLISRAFDEAELSEFIVATIPSRADPVRRHTVRGHTHGRDAVCSCWGFARHKRCAHVAAWPLILEALEKLHYADERRYTIAGLLDLARYFDAIADILNADQRLRFHGIKAALRERGVRFESTRTLAEQAEVARKARRAQDELFGE